MTTHSKALNWLRIRSWRMGMRARFLLFQRHRHNAVVLETIAGKPILVLPEVLNPRLFLTGEFLAEALSQGAGSYANNRPSQMLSTLIPPGSIVLDMGTGSGVGAVFAAHNACLLYTSRRSVYRQLARTNRPRPHRLGPPHDAEAR